MDLELPPGRQAPSLGRPGAPGRREANLPAAGGPGGGPLSGGPARVRRVTLTGEVHLGTAGERGIAGRMQIEPESLPHQR